MTTFRWLHLTDFHQKCTSHYLWPNVRERVYEDLKKVYDRTGAWDLVLFTGDLTFSGYPEEFTLVDHMLNDLWEQFNALGFKPQLLTVPGNHDLIRPIKKTPAVRMLTDYFADIQQEFWGGEEPDCQRVIDEAFANYSKWWQALPYLPDINVRPQGSRTLKRPHIPGDFACTLERWGQARHCRAIEVDRA